MGPPGNQGVVGVQGPQGPAGGRVIYHLINQFLCIPIENNKALC